MSSYHLAQLNLARLVAPLDSPRLADFVANLDRINGLADNAPGFVWRLQTEEGDSTGIREFGDELIVNMSAWKDMRSLHEYVYKSDHVEIMRRRREWFSRMAEAHMVLWWIPEGELPTVDEAKARLTLLRQRGPSAAAFTFKHPFPAPDAEGDAPAALGDPCPVS